MKIGERLNFAALLVDGNRGASLWPVAQALADAIASCILNRLQSREIMDGYADFRVNLVVLGRSFNHSKS